MSRRRRPSAVSVGSLVLIALLAIAPGGVFAQHVAVAMPENAVAKDYGSGWECDRGYQAVNEACVAVGVPANGYFVANSYGLGWKWDRGYQAVGTVCVAVTMPKNAHLNFSGNDWECDQPMWREEDGYVLP